MAHYALLNSNNIVEQVINGIDEDDTSTLPSEFSSWEEFYSDLLGSVSCKRTSYNTFENAHTDGKTAFRGNYASIGYTYDSTNDVFYGPKPYESWTLNTDKWVWQAPNDLPDDGKMYYWNEESYQADNSQGWEEV